jgi:hypothetical protein
MIVVVVVGKFVVQVVDVQVKSKYIKQDSLVEERNKILRELLALIFMTS